MGEMYFLVIFGAFGPFAAAAILTRVHQGKEEATIGVRMLYDCVQESSGIFWVVWESHY